MKLLAVGFLVVCLALFFFGEYRKPDPRRNCWDTPTAKAAAYLAGTGMIAERLKSPSTAQFPKHADRKVSVRWISDCSFLIESYVDSQNSFGATIRTNYQATLKFSSASEVWLMSNAIFLDN